MDAISKTTLFTSGLFFGGTIDHAILAGLRRNVTPYGVKVGVRGNWILAVADLAIAPRCTGSTRGRHRAPSDRAE